MQRLSPPKSSESPTAAAGTAGSDLLGGPESLLRAVWSSVAQQPVHGVLTMPGAWQLT
jgi:hypothetical protein